MIFRFAMTIYRGRNVTCGVNNNDRMMTLDMILAPGNLYFARGNAAIDAKRR